MIGCVKSELSLFDPQQFQTTMEKASWIDYHAISNLDTNGPIEFNIKGTSEDYIDVNDTMLYIKVKITKPNGVNLAGGADVAYSNMPLASLSADVQLSLMITRWKVEINCIPTRPILQPSSKMVRRVRKIS